MDWYILCLIANIIINKSYKYHEIMHHINYFAEYAFNYYIFFVHHILNSKLIKRTKERKKESFSLIKFN
jgi:hypothetical protein